MEAWKEQQQRLGAVINNNLGITLTQQAEKILPEIKKLEWYNVDNEAKIDPNLISYCFLEEGHESLFEDSFESVFFCVMKDNGHEVDYILFESYPKIDEAKKVHYMMECIPCINYKIEGAYGEPETSIMDIVIPIRSHKIAKLMDDL